MSIANPSRLEALRELDGLTTPPPGPPCDYGLPLAYLRQYAAALAIADNPEVATCVRYGFAAPVRWQPWELASRFGIEWVSA